MVANLPTTNDDGGTYNKNRISSSNCVCHFLISNKVRIAPRLQRLPQLLEIAPKCPLVNHHPDHIRLFSPTNLLGFDMAFNEVKVSKVIVHPLVLLSVVDHFNRMGKIGNQKRVVGVLLGCWRQKGVLDISNSFAGKFI